jgi:hypothetical protein
LTLTTETAGELDVLGLLRGGGCKVESRVERSGVEWEWGEDEEWRMEERKGEEREGQFSV